VGHLKTLKWFAAHHMWEH